MKRFILPLTIFLILTVFLGVGLHLNPHEIPSPFIGKSAPQFHLSQLGDTGKSVAPENLRGKVWLLNVWASWCGSCREEHPVLMEFSRRQIVPLVGLDYKDTRMDALGQLGQEGDPYVVSAFDADGRVGIDYGVYGVPETFVIDKAGVIRYKHVGPVTSEVIEQKLLPLIRELNRV